MALIRRALEELLRKRPPPPSTMRRLPEATHGYRWYYPPRGGMGTPATPPRVAKPPGLLELHARADCLRHRRRAMLERPELHQHHSHRTADLIAGAGLYVLTHDSPPPPIPQASPFERWAVAASVPAIEESIKPHQWGKQWRANDLRAMVDLEPRPWQEGEGR